MQNPVAMAELQPLHRHHHPALDISLLKDEILVADDALEICREELEDEVEVGFRGEDVEELRERKGMG
jgi:hypothetical protein